MKYLPLLACSLLSMSFITPEKAHVKDMKPLDAKAIEEESIKAHEGSGVLNAKVYDNKGFEVTVECGKETGLKLWVKWLGTQIDEPKAAHVWLGETKIPLEPDSKGQAKVRTNVFHFAKDLKNPTVHDAGMYVYEGWVMYVVGSNGTWETYKTSSPVVEKIVKEEAEAKKKAGGQ